MPASIDKRRTIRIRRSSLLDCNLEGLDKPAIKTAETLDEYTRAFRLVYDEYLQSNYTHPHHSCMHYNIWSMLPKTSVFIFKSAQDVVCTLTHIVDSEAFGLPMDSIYKPEIDTLRAQGRKIIEVGSLVTQRMRRWSNMLMYLAKAMFQYSMIINANDIVITVNPKHVRFYKDIFLFKEFGETRHYDYVNAPAVALRINLDEAVDELKQKYSTDGDFETSNLYSFFVRMNNTDNVVARVQEGNSAQKNLPLDPLCVHYLLQQRPELLDSLDEGQRNYMESVYPQALSEHFSTPPPEPARSHQLDMLKLGNRDSYADTAFCRNLGLVNYAEQRRLLRARVAIAGLGGVGGSHLMTLVRTGIGNFNLAEFDAFSPVNVNRQYGADSASFGRSKLDVMVEHGLGVNPFLDIRTFPEGITPDNLDTFLKDVDIVVDGLDFFELNTRRKMFNRALELGIPVITAAPLGHSCALLAFMPGGMNFDEYFDITDETDSTEAYLRFGMGLAPRPTQLGYMDRRFVSLPDRRGPSLDIACHICAGMAATEAMRILLGRKGLSAAPGFRQFDPYTRTFRQGRLTHGLRSPWQRLKLKVARTLFLEPQPVGAVPPSHPGVAAIQQPVSHEALTYMARAAGQAPSGDNVQPWRIHMHEADLHIYAARAEDTSFFNYRQVATLLACGAAVQNAVYAAGSLGLDTTPDIFPDEGDNDLVATLHCTPLGGAFHEIMDAALWRRHTNRRMYATRPVPEEVRERLDHMAGENRDAALAWTTDRRQLRRLAHAVYLADRVRVERRDMHEHLMRFIRFAPKTGPYGDGLPLRNLHAGFAGEAYLRLIRPWAVMHVANMTGLGRLMPLHSARGVLQSGGVALLLAHGTDDPAWLRAGMAWQRVWCGLEHMGYAMQPLAALPLLNLRLLLGERETLSPTHAALLDKAWGIVRSALPHPDGMTPLMLFRVGLARPIRNRTFRHPLARIMRA